MNTQAVRIILLRKAFRKKLAYSKSVENSKQ